MFPIRRAWFSSTYVLFSCNHDFRLFFLNRTFFFVCSSNDGDVTHGIRVLDN
jgi:hypothetical protein